MNNQNLPPEREQANKKIREMLQGSKDKDFCLEEIDYLINARQETIASEIEDWGSAESKPMDELESMVERMALWEGIVTDTSDHYSSEEKRATRRQLKEYYRCLLAIGLLKPFEPGIYYVGSSSRPRKCKPTVVLDGNGYDLKLETWDETEQAFLPKEVVTE